MIAPRLIGLCHGRPMLGVEEDAFPMGCAIIEPIASLAPYAFAIVGAAAAAVVATCIARGIAAARAIISEMESL